MKYEEIISAQPGWTVHCAKDGPGEQVIAWAITANLQPVPVSFCGLPEEQYWLAFNGDVKGVEFANNGEILAFSS